MIGWSLNVLSFFNNSMNNFYSKVENWLKFLLFLCKMEGTICLSMSLGWICIYKWCCHCVCSLADLGQLDFRLHLSWSFAVGCKDARVCKERSEKENVFLVLWMFIQFDLNRISYVFTSIFVLSQIGQERSKCSSDLIWFSDPWPRSPTRNRSRFKGKTVTKDSKWRGKGDRILSGTQVGGFSQWLIHSFSSLLQCIHCKVVQTFLDRSNQSGIHQSEYRENSIHGSCYRFWKVAIFRKVIRVAGVGPKLCPIDFTIDSKPNPQLHFYSISYQRMKLPSFHRSISILCQRLALWVKSGVARQTSRVIKYNAIDLGIQFSKWLNFTRLFDPPKGLSSRRSFSIVSSCS